MCIENETYEKVKNIEYRLMTLENMLDDIYDAVVTSKKYCPLCRNEFRSWLPSIDLRKRTSRCPVCSSFQRHRTLWLFFMKQKFFGNIKVLHFAPENGFYDRFLNVPNIDYYPVDIDPSFNGIRDVIDIQNIKYQDNMFDIIICNHVLEHVPNDYQAIRELHRVLKKDGIAYITSPVYDQLDETLEVAEYDTPELRLKYYGQHDHVRKYGKDFRQRLEQGGFVVKILKPNKNFTELELSRYGITKEGSIYQCASAHL